MLVDIKLVPFVSQIAGVPSLPCHRMSDLLSPLRQPSGNLRNVRDGQGGGAQAHTITSSAVVHLERDRSLGD
jgi:hypothetical protein